MTRHERLIARAFALAAALPSASAFAADLPRPGSSSGNHGWTFSGQIQEPGPDRRGLRGPAAEGDLQQRGQGFPAPVARGLLVPEKHTAITGSKKFQGELNGGTRGGWSDWSGESKLP